MTIAANKPAHNRNLYAELVGLVLDWPTPIRGGKMFGCPAVYVGRKLALCVYEDCIGLRVPEEVAVDAKSLQRAIPFTPYGKKPMREWIAIEPIDDLQEFQDLFSAALLFAEKNNEKP